MEDVSDAIVQELRASVVQATAQPRVLPVLAPVHPMDAWAHRHDRGHDAEPQAVVAGKSILSLVPWILGAGVVVASLLYVSEYGLHLKARVSQQGDAAIGALMQAKGDLEQLNFGAAKDDFGQAYTRFAAAQDELGLIGSDLGGLLANLPGGGKIKAARNLIQAGRLVSDAGSSLAQAISAFSIGGNLLDAHADGATPIKQTLASVQKALDHATDGITQAASLLNAVDPADLPAQTREQFTSFMGRLPEATSLIKEGSDTVAFVGSLLGADRPRRYLVLFQNSSELRPTGGFPGSYGLITFADGSIRDITTDDIYNPDGQIHELIVPPLQLQSITPSWGMRDANWFVDFPASARKVAEFYRKGGGTAVDGVIAIRPEVLSELLKITGPIPLPKYGLVITADNFLPTIQLQVESQKAATEPKQIIMDLTPLILAKLAALPSGQWASILSLLKQGLAQRDILLFMNDAQMQNYSVSQGWDGGVKQTTGDYLLADVSNIKGAKADAVTDTSLKLEGWLSDGTMVHRLTITRQHNGGDSQYGFYNKTNYSYVRILVPQGSTLRGISGNDRPVNVPMVDYTHEKVIHDPDLVALESTYQYDPVQGVTTSEESGKTEFGFWMKIPPGRTQAVQLEYAVPASAVASNYHLYVQRQPGLDISDFEFTLQKGGAVRPTNASHTLTDWPDSWRLHDPLKGDLDLSFTLK